MHIKKRRIFVITEIVHMNAGVSSEKEKVKVSQSQLTKCDTPARHPTSGAGLGASHHSSPVIEPGARQDFPHS